MADDQANKSKGQQQQQPNTVNPVTATTTTATTQQQQASSSNHPKPQPTATAAAAAATATTNKDGASGGGGGGAGGAGGPKHESRRAVLKKKRPRSPIEVLLGEYLVNAEGTKINPANFAVEGGVIGLYFAAKWCPPCREMFPRLMLLYEEVRKSEGGVAFEMVYVSFDRNEDSFREYLGKMPWWAVDFKDEDTRETMAGQYGVRGIPALMLIDASTLEVITRHGTSFLKTDPRGAQFPWRGLPTPNPSPPASEAVAQALAVLATVADLLMATTQTEAEIRESQQQQQQHRDVITTDQPEADMTKTRGESGGHEDREH